MLVRELNLEADLVVEVLWRGGRGSDRVSTRCARVSERVSEGKEEEETDLDDVQLEDHADGSPDLSLEAVHLKAVALEHNLGSGRDGDPLEGRLHLGRVDGRRRHQHVKRDREQPERRNVELAHLIKREVSDRPTRCEAVAG